MYEVYSKSFIMPNMAKFIKNNGKPDKVLDVEITSKLTDEVISESKFKFFLDVDNEHRFGTNSSFLLGIKGVCNTDDGEKSNIKIILKLNPTNVKNVKEFCNVIAIIDDVTFDVPRYYSILYKYLNSLIPESLEMELCSVCYQIVENESNVKSIDEFYYIPIEDTNLVKGIYNKLKDTCEKLSEFYLDINKLVFLSKNSYENIYNDVKKMKHLRNELNYSGLINVSTIELNNKKINVNVSLNCRIVERLEDDYFDRLEERFISINQIDTDRLVVYK